MLYGHQSFSDINFWTVQSFSHVASQKETVHFSHARSSGNALCGLGEEVARVGVQDAVQ